MTPAQTILPQTLPGLPLTPAVSATVGSKAASKVKEMAKEFEATFLSMLLKEMRQTLEPDGGLFPGDSGDIHGGLFDLYLGQHLANSGGIGFATAIEQQLRQTTTVPAQNAIDSTRGYRPTGGAPAPTPEG